MDAAFEPATIHAVCWIGSDDPKRLAAFHDANVHRLATDASSALAFLAPSVAALSVMQEKWADIEFRTTREIAAS